MFLLPFLLVRVFSLAFFLFLSNKQSKTCYTRLEGFKAKKCVFCGLLNHDFDKLIVLFAGTFNKPEEKANKTPFR